MKNVLLLDTNISSAPIYNSLIELKYNVYVVGDKPDDYLAKYSKNYFNINYGNISLVKRFIKNKKIDLIIPGCNDFSYKICSELNQKNKYFGIENSQINDLINNKDIFRVFAIKNGFPVPSIFNESNLINNISIIVKPVDSYSGNGISVLRRYNKENLNSAIRKAKLASKSKKYIIEEFVEGQLYSHSAFICNQKIYQDFFVEEHCVANPYAVDTSWIVNDFNQKIKKQIRNNINNFAKILNLKDGLIHTQFISDNNKHWIIEMTRRCPGDLYSKLIQNTTGFNYAKEYVKPFINNTRFETHKSRKINKIIRHTITTENELSFASLNFNSQVCLKNYISLTSSGNLLKKAPHGRAALIFLNANNIKEFKSIKDLLLSRKLYTIKEKI